MAFRPAGSNSETRGGNSASAEGVAEVGENALVIQTHVQPFFTMDRVFLVVCMVGWFCTGLFVYSSGWALSGEEPLSAVDAIYLMGQIITTVGYGDIVSTTPLGMYFSSGFILFSGLLISGSLMEIVDYIADQQHAHVSKHVAKFFTDDDDETETFLEKNQTLIIAAFLFLVVLGIWVFYYSHYFCDFVHGFIGHSADLLLAELCEDNTVAAAFYMGVVTLTSVGFGDVVPQTDGGKIFSFVFGFLGIAIYFNLVGAIAERWLKAKKLAYITTLSQVDFDLADGSHDGQVDLYEFTRFMILKYNMLSDDVFANIKANFEELDVDGSGQITLADVAAKLQKGKMMCAPNTILSAFD